MHDWSRLILVLVAWLIKTNSCFVTVRDLCKYQNKYQSILKTVIYVTLRPLSLHGNIRHGPNSRCIVLPRVHARLAPEAEVLAAPQLVPSFGMPMHTPSNNRVMGVALALSGRNLKGQHNNQPRVSIIGESHSGEVARGGWSAWGNAVPSFGTSNGATQN